MQQRTHDAPHMGIVVDDDEAQTVEIDTRHERMGGQRRTGNRAMLRRRH
jgi:hypothetical protein